MSNYNSGMEEDEGVKSLREYPHGDSDDEDSLYRSLMSSSPGSLEALMDTWIASYEENPRSALLRLLEVLIRSSGSSLVLSASLLASKEQSEILESLYESFSSPSPFLNAGRANKRFTTNFSDWIHLLIQKTQFSILYDTFLLDHLISFLTLLSEAKPLALRYTATFGALRLFSALVELARKLLSQSEKNAKRLSLEKESSNQRETLLSIKKELEENSQEVQDMMAHLFQEIFANRFRDVFHKIRSACIHELGLWMLTFPKQFLDDAYLKYIAWSLHDAKGSVRLASLEALQPLYEKESLREHLEVFTEKYKDRIVDMAMDKEGKVAVEAVKLISSLYRLGSDVLTKEDLKRVSSLVFASHQGLASAAGEFLSELLHSNSYKEGNISSKFIMRCADFLIGSKFPEHGDKLVDALVKTTETAFKDWKAMTDILLHDEELENDQEDSLIQIMLHSAQRIGKKPSKPTSTKAQKLFQEDVEDLSSAFIQTLPSLLRKYAPHPLKTSRLLGLLLCFDLEAYMTLEGGYGHLESLLEIIQSLVRSHVKREPLETCSRVLKELCREALPIHGKCSQKKVDILQEIILEFKDAMDEYKNDYHKQSSKEESSFRVILIARKVEVFSLYHDLSRYDLWKGLFFALNTDFRDCLPSEAVLSILKAGCFGLSFTHKNLSGGSSDESDCKVLLDRLKQYLSYLKDILSTKEGAHREESFIAVCDLLFLFRKGNDRSSSLSHRPDKELWVQLNEFIQETVFDFEAPHLEKRKQYLDYVCMLIVHNALPGQTAAHIFRHYVAFETEFGNIIHTTLEAVKEQNRVNFARTVLKTLELELAHIQEESFVNTFSSDFLALKDLAKRLAHSFGSDAVQNREAITEIHKKSIQISSEGICESQDPPPRIAFLELAAEFSGNLLNQDKIAVLSYLDKRLSAWAGKEESESLAVYRKSLHAVNEKTSSTQTIKRKHPRDKEGQMKAKKKSIKS